MLACWKCKKTKSEPEFPWKNRVKKVRHITCKLCMTAYRMAYYEKNKEKEKKRIAAGKVARNKQLRKVITELKSAAECARCGEDHPAVLDFHHRDRAGKEFSIAAATRHGASMKRLLTEIAKCDLICSNCHRKEHGSVAQ